jgi:AcrR family transcriptional regulator
VPGTTATDRRTEIVQAAHALIVERGLEGLRFGDVARAVGINNGTLLYYFPNKDALIQAVGALLVEHFSASLSLSQRTTPRPLEQLEAEFTDAQLRLSGTDTLVYTELLLRAQRHQAVARMLRDIDAQWHATLVPMLERGRADGTFRADLDGDLAATMIMTTIRGVGMQALIDGDLAAAQNLMHAAFKMLHDCLTGAHHSA